MVVDIFEVFEPPSKKFLDTSLLVDVPPKWLNWLYFLIFVTDLRECFPLTYGLKYCKSRINRHLSSVGSFWTAFLYVFYLFLFFF